MLKVLGVAFEPLDTEIIAASTFELRKNTGCMISIVSGDPYQVQYKSARKNIERIRKQYDIKIYTIEECLSGQAREKIKEEEVKHSLSKWLKKNKLEVPSSDLFLSDHIFSHYERSPYYNAISEVDKIKLFLSFCEYTASVIESYKPEVVFCIGKNYVVKNIAAAICESRSIKFIVLDHSRIESKYAFYDGFFPRKCDFDVSERGLFRAKDYVNKARLKLNGSVVSGGLYTSETEGHVNELVKSKKNLLREAVSESRLLYKYIVRFLKEFRNRGYSTVWNSYASNPFYTLAFYFMESIRRLRYKWFGLPYIAKIPSKCDFFYFPLHLRPESSVLTLGRGLDEEIALQYLIRKLPKEAYLVVKENPMMISDRRRKFYKWISSQPSVILADPLVSSYDLIVRSKGVIGISGTALLEAAILDKPCHSFGHPEFRDYMTSSGYDSLDNFLNLALYGNLQNCMSRDKKIEEYIGWILENNVDITIDRSLLKDDNALRDLSKLISKELQKLLH